MKQTYSFDDVLLVPQHSDIKSRSEVSLDCSLSGFDFNLPVIPSPMDTVTEARMVNANSDYGRSGFAQCLKRNPRQE